MIPVLAPAAMREADRLTIESGTPGYTLMQRAGSGAAEEIRGAFPGVESARVVVVAGKGNNGGDGFVVARVLRELGAEVAVFITASGRDAYEGDARTALDELIGAGQRVIALDGSELPALRSAVEGAELIVDGLLGTGFRGDVRAPLDEVIRIANASTAPVVALDVPSGVNGETGEVGAVAMRASLTLTFAAPKLGLVRYPGRSHAGDVRVVDIGISQETIRRAGVAAHLVTTPDVRARLPRRAPDAHKGDAGRVTVVGGSVGMTGAVALAAEAALRVGAGLVTAAVPRSLNDILEVKLTEAMTLPCEQSRTRSFAANAADRVLGACESVSAIALGPGISRARGALALAKRMSVECPAPLVLDADGLHAFAGCASELAPAAGPRILTPHPGEAAALLGEEVSTIVEDPAEACRRLVVATRAVVVLKGAPTIVGHDDGSGDVVLWLNPTGNAGMATGGMGDVLTGMIAGLIGEGLAPVDAAVVGVFVHGAAGDLGAERLTQWGLTASDVVAEVPEALGLIDAGEDFATWIR